MMNTGEIIKSIEKEYRPKRRIPRFVPGDVVKVCLKIKEGEKERIQMFEGVVIARRGTGIRETFKVRRIASGVGVERTFIILSPMISDIKVVKRGEVARAKLYYLRGKIGKRAKIQQMRREKILLIQEKEKQAIEAEQAESALQAANEMAAQAAEEQNQKAVEVKV